MGGKRGEKGGWASNQFFNKGGTWQDLIRGGLLGKRGDFFQGACSFYIKNKLKSQIFNDKKSLSAKMFFSVTTINLNWKILTKNLATFKDGMKLGMKNFNIMGVHWKIRIINLFHYIWGFWFIHKNTQLQWPSLNMMTSSKNYVTLITILVFFERSYVVPHSCEVS